MFVAMRDDSGLGSRQGRDVPSIPSHRVWCATSEEFVILFDQLTAIKLGWSGDSCERAGHCIAVRASLKTQAADKEKVTRRGDSDCRIALLTCESSVRWGLMLQLAVTEWVSRGLSVHPVYVMSCIHPCYVTEETLVMCSPPRLLMWPHC